MKYCFITGGCGFIGQALIKDLIKKKFHIDVLDLPGKNKNKIKSKHVRYFSGDIAIKKSFRKFTKDYNIAFHLAAQTSSRLSELDYLKDIKTNITGSYNFCEWAKQYKPKKVIFTSSMSVYGKTANAVKESEICNPSSIYGMSKLYAEKIFERLKKDGVKVLIFRLFNIYGPGQDMKNLNQGMFSIYLAQAMRNKKINVTGSLNRYRDFVYITDAVKALLIKPKNKKNWIINLGTGKKTKVKEILKIIKKNLKMKKLKIIVKSSYFEDTWGSYANNTILKKEGLKNLININFGAKETIKNILENEKKN